MLSSAILRSLRPLRPRQCRKRGIETPGVHALRGESLIMEWQCGRIKVLSCPGNIANDFCSRSGQASNPQPTALGRKAAVCTCYSPYRSSLKHAPRTAHSSVSGQQPSRIAGAAFCFTPGESTLADTGTRNLSNRRNSKHGCVVSSVAGCVSWGNMLNCRLRLHCTGMLEYPSSQQLENL